MAIKRRLNQAEVKLAQIQYESLIRTLENETARYKSAVADAFAIVSQNLDNGKEALKGLNEALAHLQTCKANDKGFKNFGSAVVNAQVGPIQLDGNRLAELVNKGQAPFNMEEAAQALIEPTASGTTYRIVPQLDSTTGMIRPSKYAPLPAWAEGYPVLKNLEQLVKSVEREKGFYFNRVFTQLQNKACLSVREIINFFSFNPWFLDKSLWGDNAAAARRGCKFILSRHVVSKAVYSTNPMNDAAAIEFERVTKLRKPRCSTVSLCNELVLVPFGVDVEADNFGFLQRKSILFFNDVFELTDNQYLKAPIADRFRGLVYE